MNSLLIFTVTVRTKSAVIGLVQGFITTLFVENLFLMKIVSASLDISEIESNSEKSHMIKI